MKPVRLVLQPLTAEAFEPFGDVIQRQGVVPEHINYGQTEKYADQALIVSSEGDGHSTVHLYRSQPATLPLLIKQLERHPLGSQAFMPLSGNPYVVLVAPPGELAPEDIRAFFAQTHQGVNYHKGTWHHYCLGLNISNDFLVVDRGHHQTIVLHH